MSDPMKTWPIHLTTLDRDKLGEERTFQIIRIIRRLEEEVDERNRAIKAALDLFDSDIFKRAWQSPITDLGYMQETGETIEWLRKLIAR